MKPNQRSNNSTENYRACVPALLAIVKDLAPRDAIAALIETAHALPNADNAEFIIFPSSASNLIRRTKGGRLSKIESIQSLKAFCSQFMDTTRLWNWFVCVRRNLEWNVPRQKAASNGLSRKSLDK